MPPKFRVIALVPSARAKLSISCAADSEDRAPVQEGERLARLDGGRLAADEVRMGHADRPRPAAPTVDRATGQRRRHHLATHLREADRDIRTVQELLGHRDVATTMVYIHVLNRGPAGVRSPADRMDR